MMYFAYICEKNSVDLILNKTNAWDKNLNFKVEKLQNDEIKFLDSKIFLANGGIKIRNFFKRDENTVITNFTQSGSPYKYKVNNIFTHTVPGIVLQMKSSFLLHL
jgi:hypothetical protein